MGNSSALSHSQLSPHSYWSQIIWQSVCSGLFPSKLIVLSIVSLSCKLPRCHLWVCGFYPLIFIILFLALVYHWFLFYGGNSYSSYNVWSQFSHLLVKVYQVISVAQFFEGNKWTMILRKWLLLVHSGHPFWTIMITWTLQFSRLQLWKTLPVTDTDPIPGFSVYSIIFLSHL